MKGPLAVGVAVLVLLGGTGAARAQGAFDRDRPPREETKGLTVGFVKPENGVVEVEADEQDWIPDVSWVGIGAVKIVYGTLTVTAARIRVDLVSTEVDAEGGVTLEDGVNHFVADSLRFNLTTRLGVFRSATADLAPSYHFEGRILEKVGAESYVFEEGTFTSCDVPDPGWSFTAERAEFTLGEYARLWDTSFRVAGVPLVYTPYAVWPIRRERTSGWLIPNLGYSSRRGGYLGMAYYDVFGRSADATLYLDAFSEGFAGVGIEGRRAFAGEKNDAEILAYGLHDFDSGATEWKYKARARHHDLPGGFRLNVEALDYSDPEFFRTFERVFDRTSLRTLNTKATLARDFGPLTGSVRLDRQRTVSIGGEAELTRLPGFELRSRPMRIGGVPIYATLLASADRMQIERTSAETVLQDGSYVRADLFPKLSAGLRLFPWLSFSPELGARETWYSKRVGDSPSGFDDEALERRYYEARGLVVGPSFYRIYEFPGEPGWRLKHVIEPRIEYRRAEHRGGDGEDNPGFEATVPRFDEVDSFFAEERVRVSLVNRFLSKSAKGVTSAREIASLSLYRDLRLDLEADDPRREGPLQMDLRLALGGGLNLSARAGYELDDVAPTGLSSSSLSAVYARPGGQAGLTWTGRHVLGAGARTGGQIQTYGRAPLWPDRVYLDWLMVYRLEEPTQSAEFIQQRYLAEYRGSCWSLFVEYREIEEPDPAGGYRKDRDYRISINLKDVGTFLDITGGVESLPF